MKHLVIFLVQFLVALPFVAVAHAQDSITVRLTGVAPELLVTTAGVRVNFVNLTERLVHVQFLDDRHRHEVVQIPGTATIWAVFHREGRHPYEVHVVAGGREVTLRGTVEVVPGTAPSREPLDCDISVMGTCIQR